MARKSSSARNRIQRQRGVKLSRPRPFRSSTLVLFHPGRYFPPRQKSPMLSPPLTSTPLFLSITTTVPLRTVFPQAKIALKLRGRRQILKTQNANSQTSPMGSTPPSTNLCQRRQRTPQIHYYPFCTVWTHSGRANLPLTTRWPRVSSPHHHLPEGGAAGDIGGGLPAPTLAPAPTPHPPPLRPPALRHPKGKYIILIVSVWVHIPGHAPV